MFPDEQSQSAAMTRRAAQVLPDGGSRSTTRIVPHGIFVASGAGPAVTDLDGNRLIDFNNNYTSLIHGHAHAPTVAAIREQAGRGTAWSFGSVPEVELAELLCERTAHFERIRFCNSGTEAVMNAIKAARAFTGRAKIAKCEGAYHGSYDFAEVSLGSAPENWGDPDAPESVAYARGTPDSVLQNVVVIPFNDPVAARAILEAHRDELAAVLFDPVSSRVGMVPPRADFLDMLADFQASGDVLLIADEVIAYRQAFGGEAAALGLKPDLTALGKIIGGGLPVGAVAGRVEVMAVFQDGGGKARLPHGGTFNANPLTMAAGLATMRDWTAEAVAAVNGLAQSCREQLTAVLRGANIPGQVTGQGSLFRIHLHNRELSGYRTAHMTAEEAARMETLFRDMINAGFYLTPYGLGCLSTAMTADHIAGLAAAFRAGLRRLQVDGAFN